MTRARRFAQIDVFTAVPLYGNPVAVILDGEGLGAEEMQQVALWTNLSETTFVLPASEAGADYHVRIFTPTEELPFAGHPTLGTAHAVIEAGIASPKDGKLVQQCGAGLVEITVGDGGLSFRLPHARPRPISSAGRLAAALGAEAILDEAEVIDTGPHWLVARVSDAAGVKPDAESLRQLVEGEGATGISFYSETKPGEIEVRSLFWTDGMVEDPVCGSGNAAVAAHRLRTGAVATNDSYLSRQGMRIGRNGEVRVRIEDGAIHVGGACVTCVEGAFRI